MIGGIPYLSMTFMTTVIFYHFTGLENSFLKFNDFPGCVRTLNMIIKPRDIVSAINASVSRWSRDFLNNLSRWFNISVSSWSQEVKFCLSLEAKMSHKPFFTF